MDDERTDVERIDEGRMAVGRGTVKETEFEKLEDTDGSDVSEDGCVTKDDDGGIDLMVCRNGSVVVMKDGDGRVVVIVDEDGRVDMVGDERVDDGTVED